MSETSSVSSAVIEKRKSLFVPLPLSLEPETKVKHFSVEAETKLKSQLTQGQTQHHKTKGSPDQGEVAREQLQSPEATKQPWQQISSAELTPNYGKHEACSLIQAGSVSVAYKLRGKWDGHAAWLWELKRGSRSFLQEQLQSWTHRDGYLPIVAVTKEDTQVLTPRFRMLSRVDLQMQSLARTLTTFLDLATILEKSHQLSPPLLHGDLRDLVCVLEASDKVAVVPPFFHEREAGSETLSGGSLPSSFDFLSSHLSLEHDVWWFGKLLKSQLKRSRWFAAFDTLVRSCCDNNKAAAPTERFTMTQVRQTLAEMLARELKRPTPTAATVKGQVFEDAVTVYQLEVEEKEEKEKSAVCWDFPASGKSAFARDLAEQKEFVEDKGILPVLSTGYYTLYTPDFTQINKETVRQYHCHHVIGFIYDWVSTLRRAQARRRVWGWLCGSLLVRQGKGVLSPPLPRTLTELRVTVQHDKRAIKACSSLDLAHFGLELRKLELGWLNAHLNSFFYDLTIGALDRAGASRSLTVTPDCLEVLLVSLAEIRKTLETALLEVEMLRDASQRETEKETVPCSCASGPCSLCASGICKERQINILVTPDK